MELLDFFDYLKFLKKLCDLVFLLIINVFFCGFEGM